LEKLFVVFETEGMLDHHVNVAHKKNGRITKGGKVQYDASGLLGFDNDEQEEPEDEDDPDPLEIIAHGLNLDKQAMLDMVESLQQAGQYIQPEILQVVQAHKQYMRAKAHKKGKKQITVDGEGFDFTSTVALISPLVYKGRWRAGRATSQYHRSGNQTSRLQIFRRGYRRQEDKATKGG
jgi:hypothetical protein